MSPVCRLLWINLHHDFFFLHISSMYPPDFLRCLVLENADEFYIEVIYAFPSHTDSSLLVCVGSVSLGVLSRHPLKK